MAPWHPLLKICMGFCAGCCGNEILPLGWLAEPWGTCDSGSGASDPSLPTGCLEGVQRRTVGCDPDPIFECKPPGPPTSRACVYGELCGWWVSSWSTCDSNCGRTGSRSRSVQCVSDLPGACQPVDIETTQSCVSDECDFVTTDWGSCSAQCGHGERRRLVFCSNPYGCADQEPPVSTEPCMGSDCSWTTGEWGVCSGECGGSGMQVRDVRCLHAAGCTGERPESRRACTGIGGCPTATTTTTTTSTEGETTPTTTTTTTMTPVVIHPYSWFVGPWSECSSDCSVGQRFREVHCQRTCSVYRCGTASSTKCTHEPMPHAEESCFGASFPCTASPAPSASTTLAASPAAMAAVPTTGNPAVDVQPVNDSAFGDWECVLVATGPLQGCQPPPVPCGADCPCCRQRAIYTVMMMEAPPDNGDATIGSDIDDGSLGRWGLGIPDAVLMGIAGAVLCVLFTSASFLVRLRYKARRKSWVEDVPTKRVWDDEAQRIDSGRAADAGDDFDKSAAQKSPEVRFDLRSKRGKPEIDIPGLSNILSSDEDVPGAVASATGSEFMRAMRSKGSQASTSSTTGSDFRWRSDSFLSENFRDEEKSPGRSPGRSPERSNADVQDDELRAGSDSSEDRDFSETVGSQFSDMFNRTGFSQFSSETPLGRSLGSQSQFSVTVGSSFHWDESPSRSATKSASVGSPNGRATACEEPASAAAENEEPEASGPGGLRRKSRSSPSRSRRTFEKMSKSFHQRPGGGDSKQEDAATEAASAARQSAASSAAPASGLRSKRRHSTGGAGLPQPTPAWGEPTQSATEAEPARGASSSRLNGKGKDKDRDQRSPSKDRKPSKDRQSHKRSRKSHSSDAVGGKSSKSKGRSSSFSSANTRSSSFRMPDPAASETAARVAAVVASVTVRQFIAELDADLDSTQGNVLEWRRRHFKELMLRWHPDKQGDGGVDTKDVFQHLMQRRVGYLKAN